MSWESCIVLLNSDSTNSLYTGDVVTGTVILEFKRKQKVEKIVFELIGSSKVQWTRSKPTIPYIQNYSENCKILYYIIDVFRELEDKVVEPGVYVFPFHFILPTDVPSSFESYIAKVRYFIKITGKTLCLFKNQKVVSFKVQGNINLNHIDAFLVPHFYNKRKSLRKSGSFSICIKTYTGFAPKQYVPFEIVLENEKKVKLTKINVILIRKIKYNVSSGYYNDEKIVHKVTYNNFSNTVTEICKFGTEIPLTVPSSIHIQDPVIEISYIFRVEVLFRFHTTLYEDIPVIIATIPVMHENFDEIKSAMPK